MVKTLQTSYSSELGSPMILKLSTQHWVLKFYKVYMHASDHPGLTMAYLGTRSNLVFNVYMGESNK